MLTSKVGKASKIVICGYKGVGKTALVEQLIYGTLGPDTEIHSTIEDTYVASVDIGRGPRETLRIFDTAGLQGKVQLPRHYLYFPDAFILVYDPSESISLDILADIKMDIDKNKEKKEVPIIVLANIHSRYSKKSQPDELHSNQSVDQESCLNRANNWCSREKIKHYTVNAMERASLYEPFQQLAIRLHPPQTKSAFNMPQLRQVMQKTQKSDV